DQAVVAVAQLALGRGPGVDLGVEPGRRELVDAVAHDQLARLAAADERQRAALAAAEPGGDGGHRGRAADDLEDAPTRQSPSHLSTLPSRAAGLPLRRIARYYAA